MSERCTIAPIRFYCDLTRPRGATIPLGFIGELLTDQYRVLGLIGRAQLNQNELEQVGDLSRPQLENVWDLLTSEFDVAWDNANPGHALDFLCARNAYALRFEAPALMTLRRPILLSFDNTVESAAYALMRALSRHQAELNPAMAPGAVAIPGRNAPHTLPPKRLTEASALEQIAA